MPFTLSNCNSYQLLYYMALYSTKQNLIGSAMLSDRVLGRVGPPPPRQMQFWLFFTMRNYTCRQIFRIGIVRYAEGLWCMRRHWPVIARTVPIRKTFPLVYFVFPIHNDRKCCTSTENIFGRQVYVSCNLGRVANTRPVATIEKWATG